MRPTVPELQRCAAFAAPAGQPIVTGIAVDLEDAVEAVEELFGMFAAAPGRIEVDDARRIGPAPGAVVPGRPMRTTSRPSCKSTSFSRSTGTRCTEPPARRTW